MHALGRRAVLDLDPLTQTPRTLSRPGGALTGPSSDAPATAALDYVRSHLDALGLTATDLGTLGDRRSSLSGDGVTHLRWTQSYRGIPAFDNELRVDVDRGGRILDVLGSPRHDLRVASTNPALSATDALRAAQRVLGGPDNPALSDANQAHLVLYGAGDVRLAWAVLVYAGPAAVYATVVDATTGRVLQSQNLVKFAGPVNASVFSHFPGAAIGGAQQTRDISPFLAPAATTLTGPNAHVFSDLDDDRVVDAGEETAPSSYLFSDFTPTNPTGSCLAQAKCSWKNATGGSWVTNRNAAATQLFWFVNEFHDHLASSPIDFDDASGAFDAGDPVHPDPLIARNDVGASLGPSGNPDAAHVNNASMLTVRDGQSPTMTTQLFTAQLGSYRDVNSADDAATVFHEYTHGMSNRLITNPDGTGALSAVQSSALGEGWSDWYAMDEIVNLGLDNDTATPGEIDFGEYTDATPHKSRSEPIDCPVGPATPACPKGGYTYGQLGKICGCGNEPHFDGEIWGQTLWDLRQALIAHDGDPQIGAETAEKLITGGMRLSPPQPSMLDERNAIIAEAGALGLGSAYTDVLWSVFANRGMGWFASTADANDGTAIEDFSMPPIPGGPTGAIQGTVTDAISGLPLNSITAGVGGHASSLDSAFDATTIATTSDGSGRYALTGIPVGSYPQLVFHGPVGYDPGVVGPLPVAANQITTHDVVLRRDWASSAGGATATATDNTQAPLGCGADRMIDQSPLGWSTNRNVANPGSMTITLPQAIDISGFGINPTATCADDPTAALGQYTIETSTNGTTFQQTNAGAFAAADNGHLNVVTPTGAGPTHAVTKVRLTMKAPQNSASGNGQLYVDATEFEIFGGPPNVLPSGTLTATPGDADAGTTQVSLQAQFTDPDSKISGYSWDFDGNGSVDLTTSTPTVTHVFTGGGTFTSEVFAQDFRGGAGTATARVRVTAAPQPPVVTTVTVTAPAPPPQIVTVTVPAPPSTKPAAPKLKLSTTGKRGIAYTVTFASRGTTRATLTVSRAIAHKLHVLSPSFTIATLRATVTSSKPKTLTMKLPPTLVSALRKRHLTTLSATLGVTATAIDRQVTTASRKVTITP